MVLDKLCNFQRKGYVSPKLEETERTGQVLGPPVLVNILCSSTFQIIQDVTENNKPFCIAVAK